MPSRRVIIESPFAGDIERNRAYARRALADSLMRGESPIAFHLLYPLVLDDLLSDEREHGLRAAFQWYPYAERVILYEDYGITAGMLMGLETAARLYIPLEYRMIGANL